MAVAEEHIQSEKASHGGQPYSFLAQWAADIAEPGVIFNPAAEVLVAAEEAALAALAEEASAEVVQEEAGDQKSRLEKISNE